MNKALEVYLTLERAKKLAEEVPYPHWARECILSDIYAALDSVLRTGLTDDDHKTVEVLKRGEKPPCQFCGAVYEGACRYGESPSKSTVMFSWYCGTTIPMADDARPVRGACCYENEIHALRQALEKR